MTKYPELFAAHTIEVETSMYNNNYYFLIVSASDSLQVNDTSLEDVTHEDAVATLKKTENKVVIVIARVGMMYTDTGTPPPQYQDAVKSSKCYTSIYSGTPI